MKKTFFVVLLSAAIAANSKIVKKVFFIKILLS